MGTTKKKDKEKLEKLRSLMIDTLISRFETGKVRHSDMNAAASLFRDEKRDARKRKPSVGLPVQPVAESGSEPTAEPNWEPLRVKEEINLPFPGPAAAAGESSQAGGGCSQPGTPSNGEGE